MNEEQKIIEDISKGDEEAFRILYENTAKNVYYYILRLVNDKELAEDLLIETYTQVWMSAKNFKGDSKVLSWIFSIARNLTMNEIKKKDYHLLELMDTESECAQQFSITCQREISSIMKFALERLSPKHREILDLIFIHDFTYEEIAKILNIPINTVKTRIFYAKKKLKEILKDMGVNKDEII